MLVGSLCEFTRTSRPDNSWPIPTLTTVTSILRAAYRACTGPGARLLPAYIALTWVVTVGVVSMAIVLPTISREWSPWGAGLLLLAAVFSEGLAVRLPNRETDEAYFVSVATIPHVMCALLLPPALAACIAGLAMLIDEVRHRRSVDRALFNTACTACSVGLTALVGNLLGLGGRQLVEGDWKTVLAVMLVAAAYYAVNTVLVAGVGAVETRQSLRHILSANARFTVAAELAASVLGGLAAFVWMANPFWLPIGLFPVAISQLALRYIAASNSKARQLAALDRLGRALSATLTTAQVFAEASAHLRGALTVSGALSVSGSFLVLSDPVVDLAEGLADGSAEHLVRQEMAGMVAESGELVSRRHRADAAPLAPLNWLALPLTGSMYVHGCFGVVAEGAAFDTQSVGFIQLVVERITLTLDNARRVADALASEQLALRTSEERFRSLVGNAGDVIAILDREGVIGYQSPAAERVWGFGPEQLVGTSLASLVRAEDQARLFALLEGTQEAAADATLTAELQLMRPDGSWRVCELMMSNLLRDPVWQVSWPPSRRTERKAFETQLRTWFARSPLGFPTEPCSWITERALLRVVGLATRRGVVHRPRPIQSDQRQSGPRCR